MAAARGKGGKRGGMLGKLASKIASKRRSGAGGGSKGRGAIGRAVGKVTKAGKEGSRTRGGFGGMAPRPKRKRPDATSPGGPGRKRRRAEPSRPSPFSKWGEGMMGGPRAGGMTRRQDPGSAAAARMKSRFRMGRGGGSDK